MRLRLHDAPAVALALSALTAAGAQAQDPGRAQRFEQRDGNRDGVLSRDEYVSTGGHPGNFRALDRNNDGVLSREEFGAGPGGVSSAPAAPASDAFTALDRNNDAYISRGEWNDNDPSFNRLDRNNDGRLSRDEHANPLDPNSAEGRFGDLDLNNDGWLSRSEFGMNRVVFRSADRNNDGRVQLDEYVNVHQAGAGVSTRFAELDRNHDGWLSRSEFGLNRVEFDRADQNNDGRVNADEHARYVGTEGYGPSARFGQLDRNRDGWLSRSELGLNRAEFDRADQNNDGRVNADEHARYVGSVGYAGTAPFEQLDVDRDGWLSRYEFGGDRAAFDLADRNNDGRVGPTEYANPRREDTAAARFDVLDRNDDRTIVRSEWRDEARSFDRLDQNNDGRITRDEYMNPPAVDDREARFDTLDRNNDGIVSRGEWRNEPLPFARVDWNNDGTVSFREYWDRGLADDDVGTGWTGRFRDFDRNGDGAVARAEWRGDSETFALLDTSRNGILERREMDNPTGLTDRFRTLDYNRDGFVSRQEWRGSAASFNFFDRDGDGRLARVEYVGF